MIDLPERLLPLYHASQSEGPWFHVSSDINDWDWLKHTTLPVRNSTNLELYRSTSEKFTTNLQFYRSTS